MDIQTGGITQAGARALLLTAILIFMAALIWADPRISTDNPDSLFTVQIDARSGISTGLAREYVYWGSNPYGLDPTDVLSRLDWKTNAMFLYGANLDLKTKFGLFLSFSFMAGSPGKGGVIEDRDWQLTDSPDVLTNFSSHDMYIENAVIADSRLGWQFRPGPGFALSPYLQLHYRNYLWAAVDGYLQYGSYTSTPAPVTSSSTIVQVYGRGITYQPTVIVPALGASAELLPADFFSFYISLSFSPFANVTSVDNHLLRRLTFTDVMNGGFFINPAVDLSFKLTPKLTLSLNADYINIFGLLGDDYNMYYGVEGETDPVTGHLAGDLYKSVDTAGFDMQTMSIEVTLRISN